MEHSGEAFSFTYSASQQEEIKQIRQKYLPPREDKMEQLRKLDKCATRLGRISALTLGVISTLVLGIGMCCTMVWIQYFTLGVVIGIVGIVGACAAYPLYSIITQRERNRLAPEILRLSSELMGQGKGL